MDVAVKLDFVFQNELSHSQNHCSVKLTCQETIKNKIAFFITSAARKNLSSSGDICEVKNLAMLNML